MRCGFLGNVELLIRSRTTLNDVINTYINEKIYMKKPNIIHHRFKIQLLFAAMVVFMALPFTMKALQAVAINRSQSAPIRAIHGLFRPAENPPKFLRNNS